MVKINDCIKYCKKVEESGVKLGLVLSLNEHGTAQVLPFQIGIDEEKAEVPCFVTLKVDTQHQISLNEHIVEEILVLDASLFFYGTCIFYPGMIDIYAIRNMDAFRAIFRGDYDTPRRAPTAAADVFCQLLYQSTALQWYRLRILWKSSIFNDLKSKRFGIGRLTAIGNVPCVQPVAVIKLFDAIQKTSEYKLCKRYDPKKINNLVVDFNPACRAARTVEMRLLGSGPIPAMSDLLGYDWSWASRCGRKSLTFVGTDFGRISMNVDHRIEVTYNVQTTTLWITCKVFSSVFGGFNSFAELGFRQPMTKSIYDNYRREIPIVVSVTENVLVRYGYIAENARENVLKCGKLMATVRYSSRNVCPVRRSLDIKEEQMVSVLNIEHSAVSVDSVECCVNSVKECNRMLRKEALMIVPHCFFLNAFRDAHPCAGLDLLSKRVLLVQGVDDNELYENFRNSHPCASLSSWQNAHLYLKVLRSVVTRLEVITGVEFCLSKLRQEFHEHGSRYYTIDALCFVQYMLKIEDVSEWMQYAEGNAHYENNVGLNIDFANQFNRQQEITLVKLYNALRVHAPTMAELLHVKPADGTRRKRLKIEIC
jgi:hypothetical protein